MHKLRTYWHVLSSSISEPEYYYTLKNTRFLFSIQFFLLTLFLAALLWIPILLFSVIPQFVTGLREESTGLLDQLPQDTVFTSTGETITVQGARLPVTLTSSSRMQEFGIPKNFLTITESEDKSSSLFTLTPTQIHTTSQDMPASPVKLNELLDGAQGALARDQLKTLASTLTTFLSDNRLPIALAIGAGLFVSNVLSGIFTIAFYTLVVQIIGWAIGVRITYKEAFRWGLHIFPIAVLIQQISSIFFETGTFPLMTVAYISVATLILWVGRTRRPTIVLQ